MKYLVTGSSGHLGEALMRTLRQTAQEVVGVDVAESPFTDRVGSIVDRKLVKECLRGVKVVFHTATLHKPHIGTHSRQDFIDANITGTLILLEEAVAAGVGAFVFTSTTSVFGDALRPAPTLPAVWVTEELTPVPKNIYGVTKAAAEDLCSLFHRNQNLPCVILRTSRFFPETDDDRAVREAYDDDNVKVNEFLFRRVDVQDVVDAHLLAAEKASAVGFDRYIISATTPFEPSDVVDLRSNAPAVVARHEPGYQEVFSKRGWKMFPSIDRVYVNERARRVLGWRPAYDFQRVLECLTSQQDFRSPLARAVGSKGYHNRPFTDGPYPVG